MRGSRLAVETGIACTSDGGVASLIIDNPPVNALALEQIEAITEAVATVPPAQPLLLAGAGAAFSAGVDTKAFARYDGAGRAALVRAISRMTAALLGHPAPLVAAVNGHALGGGFVLMLCADYRLACRDETVTLGLTEARAGVPFPAGPLAILDSELTADLRRSLTLSSRTIGVEEALRAGILDEAHDAESLMGAARRRCLELAAQPAFAIVKQQVRGALIARARAAAEAPDPLAERFAGE